MGVAEPVSSREAYRRAMVLVTCVTVTFTYAMSITIVNVSLPQMQGALGASHEEISWVITLNIVATGIALPLCGWLVERFGERTVMLGATAGFSFASLMCGVSDSLEALIFFRVLQGVFGAPLVPVPQALLLRTYPPARHGVVLAIYSIGAIVGPVSGPIIGGYLSEHYNWRWAFYALVPASLVALAFTFRFIKRATDPGPVRLPGSGFLALAVGVASFQLMLDRGQREDWFESAEIVTYTVLAVAGFSLLALNSLTSRRPFLRATLLADRNYLLGLVLICGFGMINFTPIILLPTLLQSVQGMPDSDIGLLISARGLGAIAGTVVYIIGNRAEPRLWMVVGFTLSALSGVMLAGFDMNVSMEEIYLATLLGGFGPALVWPAITLTTFATLPKELLTEGTGLWQLLRNLGSSVHISVSVGLVVHMSGASYSDMASRVSSFDEKLNAPWVMGAWNVESARDLAVPIARDQPLGPDDRLQRRLPVLRRHRARDAAPRPFRATREGGSQLRASSFPERRFANVNDSYSTNDSAEAPVENCEQVSDSDYAWFPCA